MPKAINVSAGDKYGRLSIVSEAEPSKPEKDGRRRRRYNVVCDCGNELDVSVTHLRSGTTQSCGCLNRERVSEAKTTHGMTGHPAFKVWHGMNLRCYYENNISYNNYGGRGIEVCKEWHDDPTEFCKWAELNGYKKGLQIDKIDNNGNYCPSNCRFITPKENSRNRRNSYRCHHAGKTYDAGIDLAEVLGVTLQTINNWCDDPRKPEFTRELKYGDS